MTKNALFDPVEEEVSYWQRRIKNRFGYDVSDQDLTIPELRETFEAMFGAEFNDKFEV